MSLITRVLKQKCSYWASGAFDSFGQPTFASAVELDCRWEDKMQEAVKPDGTEFMSQSQVMVNTDLSIGGRLKLSALADLNDADDPFENEDTHAIMGFDKIPNFRATEFVRIAYL